MPPRAKGRPGATAEPGPHGGQASIRKAYEALGVQHFYESHGSHYTNPHETQIFAAISQLLDEVPASVWLGMEDVEPDTRGDDRDSSSDSDDHDHGEDDRDGDGVPQQPVAVSNGSCHPADSALNSRSRQTPASSSSGPTVARVLPTHPVYDSAPGEVAAAAAPAEVAANDPTPPSACVAPDTGRLEAPVAPSPRTSAGGGAAATAAGDSPTAPLAGLLPVPRPPVTLRVLDLACGSGEASAAITDWNVRHPVQRNGLIVLAPPMGSGKQHQQRHQRQRRGQNGPSTAAAAVLPYELRITACDPYTGAAYLRRTGRTALQWSFEDIADGCLADWEPDVEALPAERAPAPPAMHSHSNQGKHQQHQQRGRPPPAQPPAGAIGNPGRPPDGAGAGAGAAPGPPPPLPYTSASTSFPSSSPAAPGPHFDLVICSFALHLCDPSRLYGTLTALSLAARWLAVLAPHKRPRLGPELGWVLVRDRRLDRTHLRLYRSRRVPRPAEAVV